MWCAAYILQLTDFHSKYFWECLVPLQCSILEGTWCPIFGCRWTATWIKQCKLTSVTTFPGTNACFSTHTQVYWMIKLPWPTYLYGPGGSFHLLHTQNTCGCTHTYAHMHTHMYIRTLASAVVNTESWIFRRPRFWMLKAATLNPSHGGICWLSNTVSSRSTTTACSFIPLWPQCTVVDSSVWLKLLSTARWATCIALTNRNCCVLNLYCIWAAIV